jgi:uncharacterized protein (DUF3084 family)
MTGLIRFLFALLLGVLIGAGGTMYLVESDAGNLLVRRTDVVQDLERRLHEMELQRDQLGHQLESVEARAARMEQAFTDLEHRFHDLQHDTPTTAPPAQQ